MANPSYFANSHGLVIGSDGNFATVHGNQVLNYFNREPERKTALTIYDQVMLGDIYRTKDFGVYKHSRRSRRWWDDETLKADRTICAAEVIGVEGRAFTMISYTGPEAREAFEKDFRTYSRTLNAGPFQVYGINTNVPTVLFYDERQPLAKFLESVGLWGRIYLGALRSQLKCDQNEIWLDPKKGELCQGPAGPECGYTIRNRIPWGNLPCSAELLQEGNCLPYLASLKARDVDRAVVNVIAWRSGKYSEVRVHQPTILSTSTNATVTVSGGLWREIWRNCVGEREVMEHGANRFTLGQGGRFELRIDEEEEVMAWIPQALSVFHARRISLDDDLKQFEFIIPELELSGYLSTSETARQRRREKTIYLFVHPLSPSTPVKRCRTSSLHYWSFDPTGQHPLPPEICEELDLPIEFSLYIRSTHRYHWNNEHYKWMHQYQVARGFDPKTTDFARHLGFPIYQVQSDSDRFEDIDAQSSPAISTSSSLGDLGETSYQLNTQLPPLRNARSAISRLCKLLLPPRASASTPSTASHTSSADSTYPNGLIHPGTVTTTSTVTIQSPPTGSTSLVTTERSTRAEGKSEEIAVPISESISADLSTTQPRVISKKANGTLPEEKERDPLLGNRRNIDSKAVRDEEGTSGKRKPPQTTQDEPAKEGLKGRETAQRGIASQENIHSQSPSKATSTSPNPRVSPRTPRNPASRLPSKSTPSASISPPKRPQIQAQGSTHVQRSVTKNAANPGMTSGKATSGPSRTRTPLPSEPIRIGSSSPKLRTPQSAKATPTSTPSTTPSSSIARISWPRPTPNAGSRSGTEGNARTPGTHNTANAPSKEVQQRRGCRERPRLAEADKSTSDLRPPRTPQNSASHLPSKSTPSASISPPKRPQIQPQESTRIQRSVTKNAANPGMTSGKATPGPSRTRTPLPSEPIRIGSSSPKLRTPQNAKATPSSNPSAAASSSIARPRPTPNAGSRSGIEGNAKTPGTHNTVKAPSKGVQQRRGCKERSRLAEADESTSDLRPPQEAECDGSMEKLESDGVGDVVRGKRPCMLNEMGGAAVQTDELKDENRRLREKIERLREMAENRRLKAELERLEETLGVGTSSLGSDGVV